MTGAILSTTLTMRIAEPMLLLESETLYITEYAPTMDILTAEELIAIWLEEMDPS